MQFELRAHLKLSKSAEKLKGALSSFFKDANKELLKKGAKDPKEGANIDKWEIRRDELILQISSGGQVRAHDGVLRLRKALAELLGKHRIGLKETRIDDFKIKLELEKVPKETISLPFVREIKIDGRSATLILEQLDDLALERNYPARIITRFLARIQAQYGPTGKAALTKTVFKSEHRARKYAFQVDPTQELINRGWVREFPGAGVWTVMPPFAALMRAIYNLVIDRIAKPMGFTEIFLPRLIPLEIHRKKGQLSGIPYEIFWVCPPAKRDPAYFQDFTDYVEITNKCAPELLLKKLRPPMFGLSYGQCEPFYDFFSKEILDATKLPFKFYDINGPTWRWEGGGLKGLERLNEFLRIEFVYAGTKEQVIKIRDEILERAKEIVDKIFDMEYRIDSTTPIYLEHAGKAEEEKEADFVKTYDLTVILPFKTVSRTEAELEIASFHVHTDFYMRRFHAKEKNEKELWTGCVGIGPSRWAFAFLTRWGLDFANWPKEIKQYIGAQLPKPPQMVTWPKKKD